MPPADPSLSVAERVDAACDAFERAWRAGQRPDVEEYLARAPEGDRAALRTALRAVQAELESGSASSVTGSHRPADTPDVPARVGRFEVRGVLGAGAFGRVYRAFDPQLQREVALKVPLADALRTAHDRDRFLKEARAAATVSHPNVCQVHEVGEHDGRPYIVMALVPGHSLAEALRARAEPLPEKQAALIVRKLALALDAAHKKGVVHRDLKPANVMFDKERKDLVVMDFGLARRPVPADARDTRSGVVMGTPAYMSPEQARGDAKDVGPAADVFSLGVMMYELLTGHRPFAGASAHEVIGRIILMNPEPPSALRSGVSPVLEAACLKALAKEPEQRFASMKEFAAAVDAYLRGPAAPAADTARAVETIPDDEGTDPALSTGTRKLAEVFDLISDQRRATRADTEDAIERAVAKARTPRWVFAAVGLAVLAAVGVAVWLAVRKPPESTTVNNTVNNSTSVRVLVQLKGIDTTDASLAFALDGKPITAAALAAEVELTVGAHELTAARGGVVVKRVRFAVAGGPNPRIESETPLPADPGAPRSGPEAPKADPDARFTGLELVQTLSHKAYVSDVRFSADGSQLLTACPGKDGVDGAGVYAWDAKTWRPLGAVLEYSKVVKVAPVGGKLVVGVSGASGSFGRVPSEFIVWNPTKRARDLKFSFETCGGMRAFDPLPGGKRYLASIHEGDESRVAVFDLATGETRLNLLSAAGCVVNDKEGKTVLVASGAEIRQIDVATEKVLRTLKGHTENVFFMTCSPDGRFAASSTSGKANELILWDLAAPDGAPVVLGKFKVYMSCLTFSPNGKNLLSGSAEGVLKLWDLSASREVASLRADEKYVWSVRFSPDGTHAITGGGDGNAKVWKLTQGAPEAKKAEPEAGFVSIFNGRDLDGWDAPSRPESFGVDPDGLLTVKGDTPTGGVHWLYTKQQYTDYVLRLEFKFALPNPTGTAAAVAPRAALEKGATGARSQRLRVSLRNHADAPRSGAVMYTISDAVEPKEPVGELTTGTWHTLELDVRGPKIKVTIDGKFVNDVDLKKIDRTLLSKTEKWAEAEMDRTKGHIGLMSWRNPVKFRNIRVKDLSAEPPAGDGFKGLELVHTLPHQMLVSDAVFSPDGSKLLTSCYNGEPADQRGVHMWDAKTGKPLGKPAVLINIGKLAYQHDKLVFGEHGNGGLGVPSRVQLHVWDPTKWARDTVFAFDGEKPGNVNSLEVLPGGKSVLASRWTHEGNRSDTAIFDLATGEHKLKVSGYASCLANDGKTILVGDGKELKQIEITTSKVIRTLKTHTASVACVACSPDGRFAASSSTGPANEIVLWDLSAPDGAPVLLGNQKAYAYRLAFAPNGKSLLSGSSEGVLKLWDVVTRKEVAAVRADEQWVWSVAFSPDGTHAVTGCQEAKAAKVWKLTR